MTSRFLGFEWAGSILPTSIRLISQEFCDIALVTQFLKKDVTLMSTSLELQLSSVCIFVVDLEGDEKHDHCNMYVSLYICLLYWCTYVRTCKGQLLYRAVCNIPHITVNLRDMFPQKYVWLPKISLAVTGTA